MDYPVINDCFLNWSMDVCMWWNKFISSSGCKRKQLYLYGPTNVGKTLLIEKILGRVMLQHVYYPGVGKLFMQEFKPDFHKVILFEEFSYQYCVPSMLKTLLEGRLYSYPVKGAASMLFKFTGPIIFVSNDLDDKTDDAIKSRLLFVSANEEYWTAERARFPKEEGLETPSSSEASISL